MTQHLTNIQLDVQQRSHALSMTDVVIHFDLAINEPLQTTQLTRVKVLVNCIFENRMHVTVLGHPELDAYLKTRQRLHAKQLINGLRKHPGILSIAESYFGNKSLRPADRSATQMAMEI